MRQALCFITVLWLTAGCGGIRTKLCGQADEPCCKDTPACAELLRCSDKNLCEACGGPGQACCANSSCSAGAVCDATNLCQPCGAKNQGCCAQNACNEGLTCEANTCAEKVICTTTCTLGASRCSGTGGVETCAAMGTCPVWKVLTQTCPANTTCVLTGSNAECIDPCPTRCAPNSLVCAASGLKRCVVPSGETCPALVTETDNNDFPSCVTGAVVSSELQWESPTPLDTRYRAIAGDFAFSFWVLDSLGNIIHNGPGVAEYEVRPSGGKLMEALASCGLGSRLYAVGQNGTVLKRGFGVWDEENVGSSTRLVAVRCDSSKALALGENATLYVRFGSTWSAIPTGFLGTPRALAWSIFDQAAWVLGTGGQVAHCIGFQSAATTSCTIENFGYTDAATGNNC